MEFPPTSKTCMSALSVGRDVSPASRQRAVFFPEVHLQRQAVGQSVQSGAAQDNTALARIAAPNARLIAADDIVGTYQGSHSGGEIGALLEARRTV